MVMNLKGQPSKLPDASLIVPVVISHGVIVYLIAGLVNLKLVHAYDVV